MEISTEDYSHYISMVLHYKQATLWLHFIEEQRQQYYNNIYHQGSFSGHNSKEFQWEF